MKTTKIIFLSLFALSLTACFDIEENAQFHKDGSGDFKFLVYWDDIPFFNDPKVQVDIYSEKEEEMEDFVIKLESIKGISKVQLEEAEDMILGVSFAFDAVNSLNKAMSIAWSQDEKDTLIQFFSFQKGMIIRHNVPAFENDKDKNDKTDELLAELLLGSVGYKTIYTFESEVKDYNNPNALTDKTRKKVIIQSDLSEMKNGNGISNTIKL